MLAGLLGGAGPRLHAAFAAMPKDPSSSDLLGLSSRELQVLQLLADGHGSKQAAALMGLKPNTVLKHARNIRAKLEATNRTHSVAIALRAGLIR